MIDDEIYFWTVWPKKNVSFKALGLQIFLKKFEGSKDFHISLISALNKLKVGQDSNSVV